MPRREPLPPELIAVPFTVATAQGLGVSRDRLRATDLVRPFRGVRSTDQITTLIDRCNAYASRMHPEHFFSHSTAAALWGMPLPQHVDLSRLHVSAPAPLRAPEGVGVVGHSIRMPESTVAVHHGLPIVSPAMTWVHLAELLAVADLVAVGDFAITGSPFTNLLPITSIDEVVSADSTARTRRGRRARQVALPLLREGPLSRPESLLRFLLVSAGLPEPEINPSVVDALGSFVAMPDLAWPRYRFAIEYEGDHHRGVAQFRRDIRRIESLIDADWGVMKVTADDLFDRPDELVARVIRRLVARGWRTSGAELRQVGKLRR